MSDQLVIITAIGARDRPGIMAALTRAVLECGGNLDDATMTRLHGAFATMIAAQIGEEPLRELRARMDAIARERDLHIALEPLGDAVTARKRDGCDGPDHIVTVYGADHPGIVHHVALLLEAHGTNITDLETRLTGDVDRPIYVMMVETYGGDWDTLPHALAELGRALSVDVSYSAIDEETL